MSIFQTGIQQNYSAAQNYYAARRKNLNKLFQRDGEELFNNVVQYIDKSIGRFQNEVVNKVYSSLSLEGGKYSRQSQSLPDVSFDVSTKRVLDQIGNRSLNRRNIDSFLGIEFERFMEDALGPSELSQQVSAEVGDIIGSLTDGFARTGGYTSTSAVVKGQKDIRPDIGLNMSMYKDFGDLKLQDGTSVELQALINIDDLIDTSQGITSAEVLQAYLNNNSYGFSLKLWKNSNNKEFSSSSVLQEMINKQFITYGPEGQRTTWESNYTEWYVVYQLSKYLLNIIGPLNIAMITGNNFIWMDDFISSRIFYMNVQLESLAKSSRGPGYEGFPQITDSAIRMRNLNNSIQNFSTRVSKKTGKISIVNRKIT